MLIQCSKTPFVADIRLHSWGRASLKRGFLNRIIWFLRRSTVLAILASYEEVCMFLVNSIVSEMRALRIQIWETEWFCRKSHQTFMVYICTQTGVEACHKHIYSQIKLKVVDKHRVWNVAWNNKRDVRAACQGYVRCLLIYVLLYLSKVTRYIDALSLRHSTGLHYPYIRCLLVWWQLLIFGCIRYESLFKLWHLVWQSKGLRGNIYVTNNFMAKLSISLLQLPHVESETILSSDLCGHWEVVNLLVFLKVVKELILISLIIDIPKPADREIALFCLLEFVMFQRQLN